MGIWFRCECGQLLEAAEGRVGERLACPACAEAVVVPPASEGVSHADQPDALPLIVEDLYEARREEPPAKPVAPAPLQGAPVTAPRQWLEEESPGAGPAFGVDVRQAPPPRPKAHVRDETDEELAWGRRMVWYRRAEEVEREHREILKRFNLGRAFLESFVYPLRGSGGASALLIPALIFLALKMVALMSAPMADIGSAFMITVGVAGTCFFCPLAAAGAFGWFHELVRAGAEGPKDPPQWGSKDLFTERLWPGVKGIAQFGVLVGILGTAYAAILKQAGLYEGEWYGALIPTRGTGLIFLAIFLAYYGMSFLVLASLNAFWRSLNPIVVVRAVRRVLVEYVLTMAFGLGVLAVSLCILMSLEEYVFSGALILWPWFVYYAACVAMSRMGFLVYRKRYALGWAHRHWQGGPTGAPAPEARPQPEKTSRAAESAAAKEAGAEKICVRCACGRLVVAPRSAAGRSAPCPACGREIRVPAEEFPVAREVAGPPPHGTPWATPQAWARIDPQPQVPYAVGDEPGAPVTEEAIPAPVEEAPPGPAERATAERRRQERDEALRRFTPLRAFASAFAFPLTGTGKWLTPLLPIAVLGVGFVPVAGPILSLGLYYGWLTQVIQTAYFGPKATLEWGGGNFIDERVWPAVKILVNGIANLAVPFVVTYLVARGLPADAREDTLGFVIGHAWLAVLWLAVSLYYLMSFTVIASYGDLRESLNPVAILRFIRCVLAEYVAVWVFTVGLVLLKDQVVLRALAARSPALEPWVAPFLNVYVICVIVSRLGFLAFRNRERLGWM